MKIAAGILGILGGVFGTIAAFVTLFFGGLGGAFGAKGASVVVGLGWGGLFFSIVTIIFGALAFGKLRVASYGMLISSILGALLGGTFVAVSMIFPLIGSILGFIGSKDEKKGFMQTTSTTETVESSANQEQGQQTPKPMTTATKVLIAIGSIFGIILVLGIISMIIQPTKEATKSTEPIKKQIAAKVGDAVSVGNFSYRVNDWAFAKTIGNQYLNKTADGVFLLIDLSLKNTSNESRTMDSSLFKLVDQSGKQYAYSTEGSTTLEMIGQKTLFLKQCQPNIDTKGLLIFEVPPVDQPYKLVLSGGFTSNDFAEVMIVPQKKQDVAQNDRKTEATSNVEKTGASSESPNKKIVTTVVMKIGKPSESGDGNLIATKDGEFFLHIENPNYMDILSLLEKAQKEKRTILLTLGESDFIDKVKLQ